MGKIGMAFMAVLLLAALRPARAEGYPAGVKEYLKPGKFVDSDNEAIRKKAGELLSGIRGDVAKVRALFEFVRDRIAEAGFSGYQASGVLAAGNGFCYNKAVLLAALCRAAGIPARIAFDAVYVHNVRARGRPAEVRFLHGITEIYVQGRWLKYDQTGNAKRWKIWMDLFLPDDPPKIHLPLPFRADSDVVFSSVGRVEIHRTEHNFFDWGDQVDRLINKFNCY